MSTTTIVIAADHGGVALKSRLKDYLQGRTVIDLGTHDGQSVDYPDYARKLAKVIASGEARRGILICGSGIGMSIAANREPSVRAALVSDLFAARLARQHNDANVLCLGARLIGPAMAEECVRAFLETEFEGGRHERRVAKMSGKQP